MTENKGNQRIPLILGNSGKTGSRVAERFRSSGLEFREGSRNSEIPFDWYDSATWQRALEDIGSVYVVFYPDLAVPGAPEIIADFTRVAKSCGVEHLVLLSGRGEKEAQTCEEIVMDSTLDWTIVRSSWFAQNFSESFFLEDILRGHVVAPIGNVKEPFLDVEDIADIVFEALRDEKHRGQLYEVTGPTLMTFQDAITEIGRVTDRKIKYQQVSMEDYERILTEAEVPQEYVGLLKYLFTEVLDGRNSHLKDGVRRALGREPRSFESYAKATAKMGVWNSDARQEPVQANSTRVNI